MLPEYRTDPPMEKYIQHHEEHIATPNLAFCASTGRTATMFMASTLASLPRVVALHEGQKVAESQVPVLPLINLHVGRVKILNPVLQKNLLLTGWEMFQAFRMSLRPLSKRITLLMTKICKT